MRIAYFRDSMCCYNNCNTKWIQSEKSIFPLAWHTIFILWNSSMERNALWPLLLSSNVLRPSQRAHYRTHSTDRYRDATNRKTDSCSDVYLLYILLLLVCVFFSELPIAMQVNLAFCCPSWRIRSFPLSHSPFRSDMNDHEQNYFVFFVFYTSPLLFIHHAVDQIDNINHNDHLFVRQMKNKFAGQWKFCCCCWYCWCVPSSFKLLNDCN